RIPGAAEEGPGHHAAPPGPSAAVRKSKPAPPPVDDLEVVEDERRPRPRPPEDEITDEPPRRRREDDYDDRVEDRPRRPRPRRRVRRRSGSETGGIPAFYWVLLGVGVGGLLLGIMGFIVPPVAVVPLVLGWIALMAGNIWFLVVAFSDDATQGFLCLCV